MANIRVIDNFCSVSYFEKLQEIICGNDFPWFFLNDITFPNSTNKSNDPEEDRRKKRKNSHLFSYGFLHYFWNEEGKPVSKFSDIVEPALLEIGDAGRDLGFPILTHQRVRGDMTLCTEGSILHDSHVDFKKQNNISCVFYLNDSDGDTVLYDRRYVINSEGSNPFPTEDLNVLTTVSPKKNRIVLFDGDIIHTGHSPCEHINRVILNINFSINENELWRRDAENRQE